MARLQHAARETHVAFESNRCSFAMWPRARYDLAVRFLLAFAFAFVAGCSSSKEPTRTATITIGRDNLTIERVALPDRDGAIDRAALEVNLRERRETVTLALAADAPYVRFLQVADVLSQLGIEGELDVGRGGPQPLPRGVAAAPIDDAPILVLTISTVAIFLGADEVTRLADIPPGDDIPALAAAIARHPRHPTRIAFQADNATPGAIVVRTLGTVRRAGVADVPFVHAVKPPAQLPAKRPE
jgi:hypothetical protein